MKKLIKNNIVNDNHFYIKYIGEVVENQDPLYEGRVKVKIYGKFDEIDTEFIPWCRPISQKINNQLSVPKIGDIVLVEFNNGNIYEPEYLCIEHLTDNLKNIIKDDYPDVWCLIYDDDKQLFIYYTKSKGIIIQFKNAMFVIDGDSNITLSNDGIRMNIANDGNLTLDVSKEIQINANNKVTIVSKNTVNIDGTPEIKIGGDMATYKAILGELFMTLFNTHTHTGNLGIPTSPPITPMTDAQLSQSVKIKT